MIPVSKPSVGVDELKSIETVFETNWLGMGSFVKQFEEKVCSYLNAPRFLATCNGTAALQLALRALGIGKGDEVIVPSLTFIASIQAITASGASPVFCDVEKETLNLDVNKIIPLISKQTKAIMPVHYRGVACDMDGILNIAQRYGLFVVEDAAHAFGSEYKGRMIGSFGHVTCFSFDPIKNITCGEGGGIIFQDKKYHQIAEKMRILGIDNDTWSRYKNKREWKYDVVSEGYRFHMPNFCAAIGLSQLDKVSFFKSRKIDICQKYDNSLADLSKISILKTDYTSIFPFMYIILVRNRDEFIRFLSESDIGTGIHYMPSHFFSFYQNSRKGDMTNTEEIAGLITTLPLYSDMTDDEVNKVISKIQDYDSMEAVNTNQIF